MTQGEWATIQSCPVLRSGKGFTWWLFGMRAMGLMFLALMLAKPTWTRATTRTDRGQVAVAMDRGQLGSQQHVHVRLGAHLLDQVVRHALFQ